MILGKWLRVPRAQQWFVFRLFLYSFLLAAAYQTGRTSADSSFLARLGLHALPAIFLVSGITVSTLSLLVNHYAAQYPHRLVSSIAGWILGGLTLASAVALPWFHHSTWLVGSIYLLAELRGTLGAISINWATHELLPRDSRFSFAAIGISVPVAGILLGVIMGVESHLAAEHWLALAGILDLVATVPRWSLRQPVVPQPKPALEPHRRMSMAQLIGQWGKPVKAKGADLAKALIGFTFFKFLVLTIITFEWKRYAEIYYGTDEQQLTAYFAIFYAVMHGMSLLMLALVAGPLLHHRWMKTTLLILPGLLFVVAVGLAFVATPVIALGLLTIAKGTDSWRRSVEDTGLIMLVSRVPKQLRTSLISLNAGVVKPIAEILAALIIWLVSFWAGDWVVWFWLGGAVLWTLWAWAATAEPDRQLRQAGKPSRTTS